MERKKILLNLLLFFLSFQVVSQNHSVISKMDSLEIKEKSLCTILDSLIEYEKVCGYYSDSLSFIIHTYVDNSYNDTLIVNITSTNNLPKKLDKFCFGYLIYKDHKVVIRDQFIDILFNKTNIQQCYEYIEYKVPVEGIESSHSWGFYYNRSNSIFIKYTYPKPCP